MMKNKFIAIFTIILLLSSCSNSKVKDHIEYDLPDVEYTENIALKKLPEVKNIDSMQDLSNFIDYAVFYNQNEDFVYTNVTDAYKKVLLDDLDYQINWAAQYATIGHNFVKNYDASKLDENLIGISGYIFDYGFKYYEEKGLLSVDKDSNGYRNYSMQDVKTLKKISVYRKLGIGIKDIQTLLEKDDKSILLRIYQEKLQEKILQDSELEALKQFIDDGNADKANEILDYQTVENAIESLLPGKEWGDYLKSHFKPFLNVRLKTLEQKQALRNILEYCDETTLKVPFIMGIGVKIAGGIAPETRTADEMIAYYRDMSESEYEKLKEMVKKGAKMKTGIMKYHPSFIAQRKMQKEFQDKGYNDIFIPNMMVLSPQYAEYKKALDKVNDRMCRELGLHYDSNYNLVIKNLE